MLKSVVENDQIGSFSKRQQLFFKYSYFVLIDLTVLNLFNEFWDFAFIEQFSISLLAALLLQVLLQTTLTIEHKVANYFKKNLVYKQKYFATYLHGQYFLSQN